MKTTLLLSAILAGGLALPSLASDTDGEVYSDSLEAEEDLMMERITDIEWVLRNNPVLMQESIASALRNDPAVIEEIILKTLLERPEIVVGSLQEFQKLQVAGKVKTIPTAETAADTLSADFLARAHKIDNAPVRGNPDGRVTIVEFSDYNCGYCREFDPILVQLIADNPDLRVIHREWPILGDESVAVAKLVLAAQRQDAYEEMHLAVMGMDGSINEGEALAIAEELSLDVDQLKEDAQDPIYWDHIQQTAALAEEINLKGTPGLIINDTLARGLVGADQIQPIIDAAFDK